MVESISGDTYTVMVGILKFRARRNELQLLAPSAPSPASRAEISTEIGFGLDSEKDFTNELKIIGLTADEAMQRVDKFLDEAYLSGAKAFESSTAMAKAFSVAPSPTSLPAIARWKVSKPHRPAKEGDGSNHRHHAEMRSTVSVEVTHSEPRQT